MPFAAWGGRSSVAETPFVSVIVPVCNAVKALPRLMNSLRLQRYPKEKIEIILVDNRSTDGSLELAQSYPDAVSIQQTRFQSPGATRNAGIERARGEILAFIDADCWAHPDWLREGIQVLTGQKLDRVAGRVDFICSRNPNIYEICDSNINFRQTDFVSAGWCGTGNLFAPKKLFEEVGLFDPPLRSCEDCEFGLRATRAGKSLGFAPGAVVYHNARQSLGSLVKKWIRTEYGAAQAWRRHGLLELHLWNRKANYRPLCGVWQTFPDFVKDNVHMRLSIDAIANLLRYAGNFGSFLGYMATPKGTNR